MVDTKNMTQEQAYAYERGYLDAKFAAIANYFPLEPKKYYDAGYRSFSELKIPPTTKPSTTNQISYNPRYSLYAKAHGKTEEEMIAHDKGMANFMRWISERLLDYRTAHPDKMMNSHILDHGHYTEFIREYVEKLK